MVDFPENVLKFWKDRASEYPSLSMLSHRYFSIPSSTSAVEISFGELKFIVNDRRTNLSASSISNMMVNRSLLNYKDLISL
uniref:HAT C-terminal dimerisation domain-containing protein n=1 Tax=Acrobeloides nanus TaxID=290746 RepID=A0A914D4A5_9BILA